ncbi:MAG: hypothetical protein RDV41_07160 [Planctomycetota bacterium]|nr:hypothetical protein [Planctomycetota bacterium]
MSKNIALNDAKPGMKVSKPVMDLAGNLLLKEGTELTDAWIERLKARRVSNVTVEDSGGPMSEEERQRLRAEMEKAIAHMFERVREHSVMKSIEECAKTFLLGKL